MRHGRVSLAEAGRLLALKTLQPSMRVPPRKRRSPSPDVPPPPHPELQVGHRLRVTFGQPLLWVPLIFVFTRRRSMAGCFLLSVDDTAAKPKNITLLAGYRGVRANSFEGLAAQEVELAASGLGWLSV